MTIVLGYPLEIFLLIMVRIIGLMSLDPFYGHLSFPIQIKVGCVFYLSLLLYPVTKTILPTEISGFLFAQYAFTEFLIGAGMGYLTRIFISAISFGGELIGQQIGFQVGGQVDPNMGGQASITSSMLSMIGLFIFVLLDGHLSVLSALADSFRAVPIGNPFHLSTIHIAINAVKHLFVLGLKISSPILVSGIVVHLALGLIGKVAPQMNVFLSGFTITIFVGLLVIYASLPLFGELFASETSHTIDLIYDFLKEL